MTRHQWFLIAGLGGAVLLVYCLGMVLLAQQFFGRSAPVAQLVVPPIAEPTATHTPLPTWTPTTAPTPRPTATLVIARPTTRPSPVVGTRTAAASAIENAWKKSELAKTYRFDFGMSAKGNLKGFPGVTNATQEIALFQITGAMNNKDSHITAKGLLSAFIGGDPTKGFEMMTVGGKTFVKGPIAMFSAPEDKWYVANSSLKTSFTDSNQVIQSGQSVDWNGFKKTAAETLDSRRCDVYTADKDATLNLFSAIASQTGQTSDVIDTMDNAETKLWICDDGYFHQASLILEGHAENQPTQKVSIRVQARAFDYNTNVSIIAPTNAAPMETPSFNFQFPTATPTRK
ncbi:MAG: hypothetical protein HY868_14355 [Chloroflexi bacterium]|nr:hypothetical protein [Chloroflexota bacterium]